MKDLAHHLKKLNRQIVRSAHREEMEEDTWEEAPKPSPYAKKQTASELKKQVKRKAKKVGAKRTPTPKTTAEKNRLQKKRVPIFDRNKAKPKVGARKTHKKTTRI
jgi:hypothetical protein